MLPGSSDTNKPAGFDFTRHMHLLVEDIIRTHPRFGHIRLENIFIAISPSNGRRNGVVAKLRPMLFEGGARTKKVRGFEYHAPQVNIKGYDILYIMYFHLPRFLNHGNQKNRLSTVLHELYHISPLFNGDVRRFSGKNYAHGSSRKKYDDLIIKYTEEYVQSSCRPELSDFLRSNHSQLRKKYGAICGDMIRVHSSRPVL